MRACVVPRAMIHSLNRPILTHLHSTLSSAAAKDSGDTQDAEKVIAEVAGHEAEKGRGSPGAAAAPATEGAKQAAVAAAAPVTEGAKEAADVVATVPAQTVKR